MKRDERLTEVQQGRVEGALFLASVVSRPEQPENYTREDVRVLLSNYAYMTLQFAGLGREEILQKMDEINATGGEG